MIWLTEICIVIERNFAVQSDDVAFDTQIGEGQANLANLIGELNKAGWKGTMAIETDSDDFARKPEDFVRKAKEFVAANDPAAR